MRVIPPAGLEPKQYHTKIRSTGGAAPVSQAEESEDESDDELDPDTEMYLAMSQSLHLDEHTPLLIGGIEAAWEEVEEMERGKDVTWTVGRLVRDWEGFWAFGLILALCIGPVRRGSCVEMSVID
jgi:hypothetical protein